MTAAPTTEKTQDTTNSFALLDNQQYMSLQTFRKNGDEVRRPVWFAEEAGRLYIVTLDGSGKVKHLRNNPGCSVTPSDARGNLLSDVTAYGTATIHEKGTPTAKQADAALNRKYGLLKRLISLTFMFREGSPVWIEIQPR